MTEMTLGEKRAEVARLQAEIAEEEARAEELAEGGSIWDALAAVGAVEAEVDYSGSGDDGDIQDVRVWARRNPDVQMEAVSFTNELGDFVIEALSREDIDWYNNEGGYGTCTFNVAERRASIEHHQRYEASTLTTFAVGA